MKVIFLFLMSITLSLYSQTKVQRQALLDAKKAGINIRVADNNYHDASFWCKTNHKCNSRYKMDDFENTITFSDGVKLKQTYTGQEYGASITKVIKVKDTLYFISFTGMAKGCVVNGKSSVKILLKNGEKLELPFTGLVNCEVSGIWVSVDVEIIDKLLIEPINKIRLDYSDINEDFDVTDKGQEKFFNSLRCIRNII